MRGKVRKLAGPVDRLLQAAANETEAMREDCLTHLGETIGELGKAVGSLDGNGEMDGRRLDRLAADIQGIAGNYGFVFVARLAGALRRALRQREGIPVREQAVIEAHAKALAGAYRRGVDAAGDERLRSALLDALTDLDTGSRSG